MESMLFDAPRQNSLDETFPGVPAISGELAAPTKVQVSKLPNGLTVVSQDSHRGVSGLLSASRATRAGAGCWWGVGLCAGLRSTSALRACSASAAHNAPPAPHCTGIHSGRVPEGWLSH